MTKDTKTEKTESKAFVLGTQFGGEFLSGITSHATAVFKLVKTSNSLEAFDGTMSEFQRGMRKALKEYVHLMEDMHRKISNQ